MIVKGSVYLGGFLYVNCSSDLSDTVGDMRLFEYGEKVIAETCTVAGDKGQGTWEVSGEIHRRLHSILDELDHEAEISHKGEIVGFDEETGKPATYPKQELPVEPLQTEPLPIVELDLAHVIQDTRPDPELFKEGNTWTSHLINATFELWVDGENREWVERTRQ